MATSKNARKTRKAASFSLLVSAQPADRERRAAEVLFHSDLEQIRMASCNCESAASLDALASPFTLALDDPKGEFVEINGSHLVTEAHIKFESFDSSETKKLVFRVSCVIQLTYHLDEGFIPTKDFAEAFASKYAVFNAWPFVREALQNLTQRMGLNPPPLPILRMAPSKAMMRSTTSKKNATS